MAKQKTLKDGKGGPTWDTVKDIGNVVEGFTGGKEIAQKLIPGGKNPTWGEVGKDVADVALTVGGGLGVKALSKGYKAAKMAKSAGATAKTSKASPLVSKLVGRFSKTKTPSLVEEMTSQLGKRVKTPPGTINTARILKPVSSSATTPAKRQILKKGLKTAKEAAKTTGRVLKGAAKGAVSGFKSAA